MSEVSEKPAILEAKIEDLLTPEGTVDIVLSTGKQVTIKALNAKEIRDVTRVAKDDTNYYAMLMVMKGLIKPKMTLPDIERMKIALVWEIANMIAQYSRTDAESIRQARFLPQQTQVETPGGL